MKIIVCIDDNAGMLFNNRRVSRDKLMIEDMAKDLDGGELYISSFSEKLLADSGIDIKISSSFLKKAKENDVCFVENERLLPYLNKIDEVTIYKWNRFYPSDFKLDLEPKINGFTLISSVDFEGKAHEKITKEIYKK